MRYLVLILYFLLAACQSVAQKVSVHTHGMDLSATECSLLERKSSEGDAEAAWRLSNYYSFEHHDKTAGDTWLRRAAELEHPQAQRHLAYLIKDYGDSPNGFGVSAPAAVQNLLERSARTEGNACYELASAYAEGYFGSSDQSKARLYFQRGSEFNNRMCWNKLSHYYHNGLGGPRNDSEAYYWISLEARCVDPRSVGGQKVWNIREEIAGHLSLSDLEHEWERIDAYIAKVAEKKIIVDFPPFLSGYIAPKLEAEGRQLSQEYEDEHRKKWKSGR